MPAVVFVEPVRTSRTFEAAIENLLEGIERAGCTWTTACRRRSSWPASSISKPTLRQALRVLERSGLLRVTAGKGGGIFMASDVVPVDAITHNAPSRPRTRSTSCAGGGSRGSGHRHGRARRHGRGLCRDRAHQRAPASKHRRPPAMGANAMFHRAVIRACHSDAAERDAKPRERARGDPRHLPGRARRTTARRSRSTNGRSRRCAGGT